MGGAPDRVTRLSRCVCRPSRQCETTRDAPARALHVVLLEPAQPSSSLVLPKICQTAMNMAAIVGPSTKPLMPNTVMPPRVEIITT